MESEMHANKSKENTQMPWEKVLGMVPDAIIAIDESLHIGLFNHGAEEIFGYRAEEVLGKPLDMLLPPEIVERHAAHIRAFGSAPEAARMMGKRRNVIGRRKDGSIFHGEASISKMEEGEKSSFCVVLRDITERERAEEALRESEERFSTIFKAGRGSLMLFSLPDRKAVEVNDEFSLVTGYTREEAIGKNTGELGMWADPSARERFLALIEKQGVVTDFETDMKHKSGAIHNALLTGHIITIRGKKYLFGVFFDITERKRAEEALRNHTEKLEQAEQHAKLGSWEFDVATGQGWWSKQMYVLLGFQYSQNVPEIAEYIAHIHPEDRPIVQDVLVKMSNREEPLSQEFRSNPEFGRLRHLAPTTTIVRNAEGKPAKYIGTLLDVTESKQATDKIQEQAKLLDEASDAIILRDLQHNIMYWNKSAERIYGWSAEEVVGKDIREILYKGDKSQFNASFQTVLKTGVHEEEFRHHSKNGKELIINKRLTIVQDDSGKPKAILSISTDITEKKKLEVQFLRTQRLESLGTLAGGIAHDLNNILGPILLSVEMLKRSAPNEIGLQMLETVESSARRGADIVKQVLSFARGVDGERSVLQIRHIVNETISIAKQTFPRSISVKEDVPRDIWTILGDATQLHQVLMNLSVNARDAMPDGGTLTLSASNVTIDEQYARMHIEAKPGKYLMIVVQDTGTGMPPEVRDRIFEPFFTTKEQGKGTGLGLSTVYSIVKSHGGFVNVYSEQGKGTAFRVYLPASEFARELMASTEEEPFPVGHGELILIVDDEESILQITRQTLEAFGYQGITASDGTEAVALYGSRGREIALVLTDMMMPIMDGSLTIRALRKMNPSVKIIASSGLMTSGHAGKESELAVNAFIAKPYTAEKLLKSIHSVLHGRPQ